MKNYVILGAISAVALAVGFGPVAEAQQPIKIGMIYSYKGVYASLSEAADKGFMLAVDEFGGKVAGRTIEIVRADDEDSNPTIGVQKAEKLVKSDRVNVLVGVISSGVGLALREFAHREKVPLVLSYAAADQIMNDKCSPYMARTLFAASAFTRGFGTYFATKYQRAATLGPDYAAGHQFLGGFKQGFEEAGGKVVHIEWTAFRKTKDWGPHYAKIKDSGAQMIFSFYGGAESIQAVKTHHEFGLKQSMPLHGEMFLYDISLWGAMGDAVLGATYGTMWIPDLPHAANKSFVEAYKKKHGGEPDVNVVFGYDNAKSLLLGIQKLNGDVSDGAKLIKAVATVEYESPRGKIKFDAKNNDITMDQSYIVKVEKGADGKPREVVVDRAKSFASPSDKCNLSG